jgi:hypothetical protein
MTGLENRLRAALRHHAEDVDRSPLTEEPRSFPGRVVAAALVAAAFAAAGVAAAIWVQPDPSPQAPPTASESTSVEPTPESCSPPTYLVSRLPWLPTGSPIPAPEVLQDDRSSVTVWFEDREARWDGSYVALTAAPESPFGEELASFPTVEVRGILARLVWVGDPGVGGVVLVWTEGAGACTWRTLGLSSVGMSEVRAERALKEVADSLT